MGCPGGGATTKAAKEKITEEKSPLAVKLRKRNGKWWVFIDHRGRRKAKCIGMSKSAAEQVAGRIEAAMLGQPTPRENRAKPTMSSSNFAIKT